MKAMALNIVILAVEGTADQIDDILPDVYFKSQEGLIFEEAIEPEIDRGLTVTTEGSWVIIIDVLNRFVDKETFPLSLSKRHKCKMFWLSDEPLMRTYEGGQRLQELKGKSQAEEYLKQHAIAPLTEEGEMLILQVMYHELFGLNSPPEGNLFSKKRFDLYELD